MICVLSAILTIAVNGKRGNNLMSVSTMEQYVTLQMKRDAYQCAIETAAYNGFEDKAAVKLNPKHTTFGEMIKYKEGMDDMRQAIIMRLACEFTGEMYQVRAIADQRKVA